jgi:hypothetical protein
MMGAGIIGKGKGMGGMLGKGMGSPMSIGGSMEGQATPHGFWRADGCGFWDGYTAEFLRDLKTADPARLKKIRMERKIAKNFLIQENPRSLRGADMMGKGIVGGMGGPMGMVGG